MSLLNVAAAYEAVVKHAHYISEMSQNCECFNHRGERREGGVELARQSLEYFWNIIGKIVKKFEMYIPMYVQFKL
jgi:hypothetical protein